MQNLVDAHSDERFEYDEKLHLAAEHEAETVKKLKVRDTRAQAPGDEVWWVQCVCVCKSVRAHAHCVS